MTKHIRLTVSAALLAIGLFSARNVSAAAVIAGSTIKFDGSGSESPDGNMILLNFGTQRVVSGTWSFAHATGDTTQFSTIDFNPSSQSVSQGTLFHVDGFTFYLMSLVSASATSTDISLDAVGFFYPGIIFPNNNAGVTPAEFSINATGGVDGSFAVEFSGAKDTQAVPDGETTAALLGGSVVVLALLKRALAGVIA